MKKITRTIIRTTYNLTYYVPVEKTLETVSVDLYEDDTPAKYAKRNDLKVLEEEKVSEKSLLFEMTLEDFIEHAKIADNTETESRGEE